MATLLTFRLDKDTRDRVRARLKRDGVTLSAVVTRGLRDYVSGARRGREAAENAPAGSRALPDHVVSWLRELRSAGRSQALSAALADLHGHGWPLARLAQALGVSKQAVQARVRRASQAIGSRASTGSGATGSGGVGSGGTEPGLSMVVPAFVRRRPPTGTARPHLTVRIDQGLRAAAHRVAADDGRTLTQVVETILDHYLHRGLPSPGTDDSSGERGVSVAHRQP